MKRNSLIFRFMTVIVLFLISANSINAQEKGYIIEIDGNSVYIDYTSVDINVGDRLQVISAPKVMRHPVTQKEIVTEGAPIATIEITKTQNNYSVSTRVFPARAIEKLRVGQRISLINNVESDPAFENKNQQTVTIAPAEVNDVAGTGYFGNYVADLLMAEMLDCDNIKLIDRSVLNAQIDETNLADAGLVSGDNTILKGQIAGVQKMIRVTMQRPDVSNISTGIPIHSILSAAGSIASVAGASSDVSKGLEIGTISSSNVRTSKLKAQVSITARVIDVQTGEVLFMCSGKGIAQGKSQLSMEEGALNGLQLNGGAEGFRQTITGKAVALAYRKIGNNLKRYFNGETQEKIIKSGLWDSKVQQRKGKLYVGVNKLSMTDIKEMCSENPQLYFDFKKAKLKQNGGMGLKFFGAASILFFGLNQDLGCFGTARDVDNVLMLLGGVVSYGGYLLQKSGRLHLKKCIDSYNKSLMAEKDGLHYDIGLSPGGLALRINF